MFDRKAYMKAYLIKWRAENREYIRNYSAVNKGRWPKKGTRQIAKDRFPEAIAARDALNNAVRLGKIVKPKVCDNCSTGGRIHGHHADYSKPLEVRWLCPACHGEIHRVL